MGKILLIKLLSFDVSGRVLFMDIVDDLKSNHHEVITSNIPLKNWYDLIGEQIFANAILDKLEAQSGMDKKCIYFSIV
jgi:DNA replication protein DnaC